jgi:uncharacterized protein YndB with AHSA1/START domain
VTKTITVAPVRRSITVPADSSRAFAIFTACIDTWWPESHGMGGAPFTHSAIEPFIGGRWYAERADGSEVTIARVIVWEPGHRLVVRWEIGAQFVPAPNQSSVLEIRFIALGAGSTRVELEHRDFDSVAGDAEAYRDGLDRGWPVALDGFAAACRNQTRA